MMMMPNCLTGLPSAAQQPETATTTTTCGATNNANNDNDTLSCLIRHASAVWGKEARGRGATESEKRLRTRRTWRMPLMRAGSDAILFLVLLSFTHVAAAFVASGGNGMWQGG